MTLWCKKNLAHIDRKKLFCLFRGGKFLCLSTVHSDFQLGKDLDRELIPPLKNSTNQPFLDILAYNSANNPSLQVMTFVQKSVCQILKR